MTLYSGHIFMYVFMPAHITKTASIDRVSSCPRHCLVEGLGTCGLPQDSRNLWDRLSVALSSRKGSESEMLWRCWVAQLDLNPSNLAAGSALVSLEVGHALCLLPSIYVRGWGGPCSYKLLGSRPWGGDGVGIRGEGREPSNLHTEQRNHQPGITHLRCPALLLYLLGAKRASTEPCRLSSPQGVWRYSKRLALKRLHSCSQRKYIHLIY